MAVGGNAGREGAGAGAGGERVLSVFSAVCQLESELALRLSATLDCVCPT